jgi:hypothetical protein
LARATKGDVDRSSLLYILMIMLLGMAVAAFLTGATLAVMATSEARGASGVAGLFKPDRLSALGRNLRRWAIVCFIGAVICLAGASVLQLGFHPTLGLELIAAPPAEAV